MKDFLVVAFASLGSATALTAFANLYVKFIQKRNRNQVQSAQARAFAKVYNGAVFDVGRFAAAEMTFAVLCSESARQIPLIRENLLGGDAQAQSAPAENVLANAGA